MRAVRIAAALGLTLVIGAVHTAVAQTLPSHGSAAQGSSPVVLPSTASQASDYMAWKNDVGLDFIFVPSPDDDRFEDGMGLGMSLTFPFQTVAALRLNAAYESYTGEEGVEDGSLVPFGFTFLIGPPIKGPLSAGLEAGLTYNVVDFEDAGGEYDNGVGAYVGVNIAVAAADAFGVEFGVGYRLDISESQNDADEKLSLEGAVIRFSLRYAF